jgi:hypothetical protein
VIDLNNIWQVIALGPDPERERREHEDYLRQHPSAEEVAWQDQEAQRDYDRARDQQEWTR